MTLTADQAGLLHRAAAFIPTWFGGLTVAAIDQHEYRLIRAAIARTYEHSGERDAMTVARRLIAEHVLFGRESYDEVVRLAAMTVLQEVGR